MDNDNLDAAGLDPQFEEPIVQTPQDQDPPAGNQTPPAAEPADDNSLINDLLAQNGIRNPEKIQFEDESGKLTERSWKDLSKEEKLNILSSGNEAVEASDYTQEEIELINKIRDSHQSPADYLASLERAAAQATESQVYDIDGISDDELFVLDALDRYGNEKITDEQLEALLKNAKSDEDLYAKTIENLREQYKQKEDDLRLQKQQQNDALQEQEYNNFSESILNEIRSLTQVAGQSIELSVDDMNDLANYILTRDEDGNSEFGKAMNDPKLFTQMAFWALKGNDIMNEISSQLKMAYEQGLAAGKQGQSKLAFSQKLDKKVPSAGINANELDVQ